MSKWIGRCAGCKYLRRKCPQDCVLAPYFPSNDPQRFSAVHKIFGASNIAKMLQQIPDHLRMEAADCMVLEAYSRIEDPIYGCVRLIYQLQQQIIEAQYHTIQIEAQIAFYINAQNQQDSEPSCMIINSIQQEPFSSFDQNLTNNPNFGDFGL